VVTDLQKTRDGLILLTRTALRAASSMEEVAEVAEAAAAIGDDELIREVADRIGEEVEDAIRSSGAWDAELTYSKVDAWAQTGHRAKALAKAWGFIAPLLSSSGDE